MISNSTWTFELLKEMNDAACPAAVGLSAEERMPKYSLRRVIVEGRLAEVTINPDDKSSSSANWSAMLTNDVGSKDRRLQKRADESIRDDGPDIASDIPNCLSSVACRVARITRPAASLSRSEAADTISYATLSQSNTIKIDLVYHLITNVNSKAVMIDAKENIVLRIC